MDKCGKKRGMVPRPNEGQQDKNIISASAMQGGHNKILLTVTGSITVFTLQRKPSI